MTRPEVEEVAVPLPEVEEVAQRPSRDRRLVLLRHGRTSWNADLRIQGQQDSELDAVGVAQAEAVAPVIAALSPVAIRSSDLSRAWVTASAVGAACGLPVRSDERLREYSLGAVEGLTHEEYAARDPEGYARFRAGDWSQIAGAEQADAVAARFAAALDDLIAGLGAGELGVAVSHGAAIRTGLVHWLGWPLEHAADLRALGNCGRVELAERENGRWNLSSYGITVGTPT